MHDKYEMEEPTDIFVGCKEKRYLQRVKEKAEDLDIFEESELTPKVLEQSPYKLHISLSQEDYAAHKEQLKEIVLAHLLKGAIYDFKFNNDTLLSKILNECKNKLKLSLEYQGMIEKGVSPKKEWEDYFLNALDKRTIPDNFQLTRIIEKLVVSIKGYERLLFGDQFTIYVPEEFDRKLMLDLCEDIELYSKQNNLKSGNLLDVESAIGRCINFRQEYLLKDFAEINATGFIDFSKRISTVRYDNTESEDERRKQVVIEQEQSDLFKFLKQNIQRSQSDLQQNSLFSKKEQNQTYSIVPPIGKTGPK